MQELLGILDRRAQIGDAVLSGGVDPISLMIQLGTRSRFSHMAVVTGPGEFTEAYDYAFNPDETDDGIYRLPFDRYVARAGTMRQLVILRPTGIDQDRLVETAAYLREHSPGFPGVGMLLLALCGLSTPILQLLPASKRSASTMRQVMMAGDGIRRMHCAETATRIYHEAGLPIRFEAPRLRYHLLELTEAKPGNQLATLPTERREAERGHWPRHTTGGVKGAAASAGMAYRSLRRTLEERSASPDPVDVADLIMPGDFLRARPFENVGRFNNRSGRWEEVRPAEIHIEGRPAARRLDRVA